jgi:hypothetical protein
MSRKAAAERRAVVTGQGSLLGRQLLRELLSDFIFCASRMMPWDGLDGRVGMLMRRQCTRAVLTTIDPSLAALRRPLPVIITVNYGLTDAHTLGRYPLTDKSLQSRYSCYNSPIRSQRGFRGRISTERQIINMLAD